MASDTASDRKNPISDMNENDVDKVEIIEPDEYRNITADFLKIIACITMLIDHIGAVVIYRGYIKVVGKENVSDGLYILYSMMRLIGRVAFPIYCFLMIEGFYHTRNRWKYLRNLTIFAIISEVPFDLAFSRKVFCMDYQSVYITLILGLITVMIFDKLTEGDFIKCSLQNKILAVILSAIPVLMAWPLKTDYKSLGVLLIFTFYIYKKYRDLGVPAILVVLGLIDLSELFAAVDFALFTRYNGKKGFTAKLGRASKYFFYAFYPLHLLILTQVRYLIFK